MDIFKRNLGTELFADLDETAILSNSHNLALLFNSALDVFDCNTDPKIGCHELIHPFTVVLTFTYRFCDDINALVGRTLGRNYGKIERLGRPIPSYDCHTAIP